MAKTILFLIGISLISFSCSKQVSAVSQPENTIRADFDGVSHVFNVKARATSNKDGLPHEVAFSISIDAADGSEDRPHSMSIMINSNSPIAARTYLYNPGDYTESTNALYQGTTGAKCIPCGGAPETFMVKITSLTATNVKGIFSGSMSDGEHTQKVTNGEFNVNF